MKKFFSPILAGLLLCVFCVGCAFPGSVKSITIASKTFTENILLSEMYAQLVENLTDIKVVRKQALGGTPVCYSALQNEEIDMYVEYTGTLYTEALKLEYDPDITPDEIYDTVKSEMNGGNNTTIFRPIGLNNTFALAMQRGKADAFGVKKISDLAGMSDNLIFAANSLYYTRLNDGYSSLTKKYGIEFKSTAKMDYSLLYDAVDQGHADVIVVYTTDSFLEKYNITILEDDKQLFPDYRGVPMILNKTLKKYPELNDVLDLLSGRIDNERMRKLNYLVDVDGKTPAEVAVEFLSDEGLLI